MKFRPEESGTIKFINIISHKELKVLRKDHKGLFFV